MPRKSKTDELREKFEVAIAKSLESDSAAERTQALRSAGDLLNPNLTDLQKQVKQAEDAREVAETALIPLTAERDTLLTKVAELQPLADRLPGVETEHAELKANFDARVAAMREELLEDAQQERWNAQAAERRAKDALKEAQQEFTKKGYDALLDAMRDLIAANHVEQPDIWHLRENVNPLFLTLWPGWTPIKAQLFVAYTKNYPEPTEAFKQTLERCLKARLPIHDRGTLIPLEKLGITPDPMPELSSGPKPIEHLTERIEVLTMMCQRWPGVLEEVQRRVEEEQVRRQADFLRNHHADLAAAQSESSRRGEGRTPIVPEVPVSSVPLSEHLPGCVGPCCSPGLRQRGSLEALDGVENF